MYCATCRKDISLPGSRRNLVSKGQTDFRNILSELFAFHPQEDAICRECAWKLTRVEKIEGEIGVKRVKLKHDFEVKCAKLNHEKTELIKKFELHLKENRNYTPIRRPPNKVHENDRSKPELINQGTQTELSEQYMDSYTPKFRKSPNKLQPIRPKRKPETPEQTPVSTKRVDVKPTPVKNAKRRPLFTSPRKPVARKPVAKVVVVYDSQTKTREITDSEQDSFYLKLCKGIIHNEKDRLGRLVMTDPAAAESVLKYMNKTVSEEVRTLTSKKHNSYLQQIDCQSLMTFKWKTFEDELKVNAPLFFKLLSAACDKSDILPAPVLFSVATILRSRNSKMSAAHHIVALMLDDGGCKDKWVFLPDPSSRDQLTLPPKVQVDYRAACFCHRNLIDIGYVCSVCLSIFCTFSPICSTCHTTFKIKGPPKIVKKKSKKSAS